eukprot:4390979-Pleurochrysis_carterae.AAC.2
MPSRDRKRQCRETTSSFFVLLAYQLANCRHIAIQCSTENGHLCHTQAIFSDEGAAERSGCSAQAALVRGAGEWVPAGMPGTGRLNRLRGALVVRRSSARRDRDGQRSLPGAAPNEQKKLCCTEILVPAGKHSSTTTQMSS